MSRSTVWVTITADTSRLERVLFGVAYKSLRWRRQDSDPPAFPRLRLFRSHSEKPRSDK